MSAAMASITSDVTSRYHPYKLMLSCPYGLSPSQVSVIFDKAYDRISHPDLNLENSIAEIWDRRVSQNPSLYNGKKFRYGGHALDSGAGDEKQECHVFLHLGLTDYSGTKDIMDQKFALGRVKNEVNHLRKQRKDMLQMTFVGTNLNPLWEKFLVQSEDESVRCQHTSSPLGNGAIIETSDGKILLLKRSNSVGEFPGHFVFPGGHPEPEEVGIISHDNGDPESLNKRVPLEMFDSIVREVVEETGVPAISLCTLQSEEIEKLYGSAQDGFESTQLHAVLKDELENVAWKMPGCHHGGVALYRLMLEAVKQN